MEAKHKWQTSKDAVPMGFTQVTVYAESTGDRVATVFDADAVPLIAAAPDMRQELFESLAVLEVAAVVCETHNLSATAEALKDLARSHRAAIARAEGRGE